jgi:hypothetical protein
MVVVSLANPAHLEIMVGPEEPAKSGVFADQRSREKVFVACPLLRLGENPEFHGSTLSQSGFRHLVYHQDSLLL